MQLVFLAGIAVKGIDEKIYIYINALWDFIKGEPLDIAPLGFTEHDKKRRRYSKIINWNYLLTISYDITVIANDSIACWHKSSEFIDQRSFCRV